MSWYVDFFRGDYQRVFSHDEARSAVEAAFARRVLGLGEGDRILDLCCGAGRHLRPLGAVGVDLHAPSLRGLPAARAEMRALPIRSGSLHAVVSFFSSFGYLESDAEDERVLREIRRALRPDGCLFLDLLNREHALAGFVEVVQRQEPDGTLVVERRAFDAPRGRLSVGFVLVAPDGGQREFPGHRLRLYTLTELRRMLERAGLALQAVYGGFDGTAYALDSPRMIAVATASSPSR